MHKNRKCLTTTETELKLKTNDKTITKNRK